MTANQPGHVFITRRREGSPRGDLYELEQTYWTDVIDTRTGTVCMIFETRMEASLDRDSGTWSDSMWTGARDVLVAEDDRSVSVISYDGRVDVFPLPLD